ncbi:MAG: hypothetical protein P1U57_13885, partial [Oleibacter sp.]|nr:hypothetical protein [Thalassolituus sp.]
RIMIEHRFPQGYDAGLSTEGLLITEVNDKAGFGGLAYLNRNEPKSLIENTKNRQGSNVVSGDNGTVVRSAERISLANGKVTLNNINTNSQASLVVEVQTEPKGRAYGYDDVPANATWGALGSEAFAVITMPVDPYMSTIDGLDFFAQGKGTVDVGVYRNLTRFSAEDRIVRQSFAVVAGWNRLLFSQPSAIDVGTLYIEISSKAESGVSPFLVDVKGQLSGKTQVKTKLENPYYEATFDISARLLASTSDVPTYRAPSESASGSKKGGGGAITWTLLIVFLLRKRVY